VRWGLRHKELKNPFLGQVPVVPLAAQKKGTNEHGVMGGEKLDP